MRWAFFTKVLKVWQHETEGWFVHLEGSYESLHLGAEKPELEPGDRMKITLEKVHD